MGNAILVVGGVIALVIWVRLFTKAVARPDDGIEPVEMTLAEWFDEGRSIKEEGRRLERSGLLVTRTAEVHEWFNRCQRWRISEPKEDRSPEGDGPQSTRLY